MTRSRRSLGGPVGEYMKLCAIVETTKGRVQPLRLGIILADGQFALQVSQIIGVRKLKVLATVPFDPKNPDAAAHAVAKKLTLDGELPSGLGEADT